MVSPGKKRDMRRDFCITIIVTAKIRALNDQPGRPKGLSAAKGRRHPGLQNIPPLEILSREQEESWGGSRLINP